MGSLDDYEPVQLQETPCGSLIRSKDIAQVAIMYGDHLTSCRDDRCIQEFYASREAR